MNESDFWKLIERSREAATRGGLDGSQERQVARLEKLLDPLPAEEIIEFRNFLYRFMDRAFTWDLLAVSTIIGQGCSDDYFDYFRAWLVSMGQEVYERVLKDPEAVDEVRKMPGVEDIFFELITYVPGRVYEEKTGRRPPVPPSTDELGGGELLGTPWSTDAELRDRFPRLFEKYADR